MRNLRLLAIGTVLLAIVLVTALNHHPQTQVSSKCGIYRSDKTVEIKNAKINTEVPKTPEEFTKGLGGRQCIGKDQGMLFAFAKPGRYPFWMKDMNFPIDIVWIGPERTVIGLDINLKPSSYPDKYVSSKPAQYVLELQANRSQSLHIDIGTPVKF